MMNLREFGEERCSNAYLSLYDSWGGFSFYLGANNAKHGR